MKVKKKITVPKRLKHYIMPNLGVGSYTTYGLGSMPGTVKKWWKKAGATHDGGIATINGAYLVAMTNTFGADGDVMQVFLNNGQSFWVIKCDTKSSGDSNWTKYGHNVGGVVDVLEWYGDMSKSTLTTTLKKKKYSGKRVSYVLNYGRYTSTMDFKQGGGAVQLLIDVAKKHIGPNGRSWVQKLTSIGGQAWCAATMCAVAKESKFGGKIMPTKNYSASGFGKSVVEDYGGKYIPGGKNAQPQPGDFAEFHKGQTGKWASGHIGLVVAVKSNTVRTIEGNHWVGTGKIGYVNRNKTEIGWYARPDWSKVGGPGFYTDTEGGGGGVIELGPLYNTASTRADAMIREVAYIDNKGVATTNHTDKELSVLNYTSTLAAVYALFGGSGESDNSSDIDSGTGEYDLSKITNKVARRVIKFFLDNGLTPAGACAIVGNMQQESGLHPGYDDGTNYGLCNWTSAGNRASNMKKHAGKDWKTDVEGQCDFILNELDAGQSGYQKLLKALKSEKNTEAGCKKLTEQFCNVYERAGTPVMSRRKQYAVSYWKKIKVVSAGGWKKGDKLKWPCPGHKHISSGFGPRSVSIGSSYHRGIDIPAPIGTTVVAAADGKVIEATSSSARGKYVTLAHGNKFYTRYQHLSKQSVKKGDKVAAGKKIGEVGNTGASSGPHLHFETLVGGITYGKDERDPTKYL